MSMNGNRREVINTAYGPRVFWVDAHGNPLAIADANPGFASNAAERDLYSRLPAADIAGMVGPGVQRGGEQPVGLIRSVMQAETHPAPAPTYRPLGGAQQNNRGAARIITVDTLNGTPQQEIPSIVETPRDAGQDAEAISVALGLIFVDQDIDITSVIDNTVLDITARIQWGVGGAAYSADVDWNQGTTFALPASFVSVGARIGAIPINALFPGVAQFTLAASLAYHYSGSSGTASTVRRTISVGDLTPGTTSAVFRVPRWSNSVTLIDSGVNAPALRISFHSEAQVTAANSIVRYDVVSRTNLANQNECQFPIPPQARFFVVTNIGFVDMRNVRAIFNLAL